MKNQFQINFSPSIKDLEEIEAWLIKERNETGGGFHCNWHNILASFNRSSMISIIHKNSTIGFTTFWISTEKIARIDVAEVKPTFRGKGVGKIMVNEVERYLEKKGISVIYLQCSPKSSLLSVD